MDLTKRNMEVLAQVAAELEEQESERYPVSNIDSFSTWSFVSFQSPANHQILTAATLVLSRPEMGKAESRRIEFWKESSFVDAELTKIFAECEGGNMSADKARTVIKKYDEYLASGKMPDEMEGKRPDWIPQKGSWEQWFDVVRHIESHSHGLEYARLIIDVYA